MKNSSRIAFLLIAFMQVGCEKDEQIQKAAPAVEDSEKKYDILNIDYTPLPSGVTELVEQRPALEYSNGTSVRQKIIINPNNIFERSSFKENSSVEYTISNPDQKFSVPMNVQAERLFLGPKKWIYDEHESKMPTQLRMRDSVYIEPGSKVNVKFSVIYKKIQTSYSAQLKAQKSSEVIYVTGIWTGVYPVGIKVAYTAQSL